jgi:hypothetical protein
MNATTADEFEKEIREETKQTLLQYLRDKAKEHGANIKQGVTEPFKRAGNAVVKHFSAHKTFFSGTATKEERDQAFQEMTKPVRWFGRTAVGGAKAGVELIGSVGTTGANICAAAVRKNWGAVKEHARLEGSFDYMILFGAIAHFIWIFKLGAVYTSGWLVINFGLAVLFSLICFKTMSSRMKA